MYCIHIIILNKHLVITR